MSKISDALLETLFWSEGDEWDEEQFSDVDQGDLDKLVSAYDDFQGHPDFEAIEAHGVPMEHNFVLSVNGHGAGFFDCLMYLHDKEIQAKAERLQDYCSSVGPFNLYKGDDGKIYIYHG